MDYFNNVPNQSKPPEERQPSSPPSGTSPYNNVSSSTSPPAAPTSSMGPSSSPAPRIRRRNRMITSCLECRRRKLKCNKSHPCTNCVKFNRDCMFLAPALDQASQLKLTEIKEKVGSLERLLERDVAKNAQAQAQTHDRALPDDADDDLPANEDEKDLEPTPLAVPDAAYGEDGDDDELLDLGIQMGRMRITERIGGFFRPKIAEETLEEENMASPMLPSMFNRDRPKNKANPYSKLQYTVDKSIASRNNEQDTGDPAPPFIANPLPPASEWLKPGPSYIMPSSGFFFGNTSHQASLIDFLPSRLAADRLIKQYFTCVHTIAQIVHRPTFEREYGTFWDEVSLGIEPQTSVQAIIFAAMFSGVVSMDESVILRDFGVSKASLIDNFKLGTETALARANFLRTTKIETLQAFVMYLIPLCRAELSRAHSVLLGAAIRMAECMGLHRDGSTYGMNPLETHVRRLIWHQLCFLDIRTCEAQGPRPTIRRDEYDTKLPLNVDDADLHATGLPPAPADRWTDVTFSKMRFEIYEMTRTIWVDRPRIERRKISLTAVLSKIETFKSNMAAKYDHMMDDRIPVQKCAKHIKASLLSRLYIMVLHRYHNSVVSPMPDRLRNIMLMTGTTHLEVSIALETLPELRNWKWYLGAMQQYHAAFLLLMEVYAYPKRKEADRIWACLDYIFECDPNENRHTKGLRVLSELQQKTAIYQSMRGMRAPVQMNKHLGMRSRVQSDSPQTAEKGLVYGVSRSASEESEAAQRIQQVPVSGGGSISIGRAPVPDVVFAGVSNGESLWALPTQRSPEGSDTLSNPGQEPITPLMTDAGTDDLMADIDWGEYYAWD
ncbi:Bikaverin cluster transcription factor [Lachnellula hyalina]|uniref:Bikaverin cluster transcription factor n=1 Tax=Lachnellula hyalina TaxID=1316788 RepID=A0A8H8R6K7_9HELO|nr:Bikaverin cluster transcription factor [Lachnellula hyalina]TVY28951.1 Bikaverin cluster transcription factor [Lachnellula hyalina]